MKRASARHILVATEQECLTLKNQIQAGADFAEIAKKHSQCPSGRRGGDLGEFGPGQMVREFENAAFSMERGQISKPVKSRFGWHIVKLVDAQ